MGNTLFHFEIVLRQAVCMYMYLCVTCITKLLWTVVLSEGGNALHNVKWRSKGVEIFCLFRTSRVRRQWNNPSKPCNGVFLLTTLISSKALLKSCSLYVWRCYSIFCFWINTNNFCFSIIIWIFVVVAFTLSPPYLCKLVFVFISHLFLPEWL